MTYSDTAEYEMFVLAHVHEPMHVLCLGLAGEVGEVCDILKKDARNYRRVPLDHEHLKEELGDLLWYLTAVSQAHQISLIDLMKSNIAKLQERYA